MIAGARRLVTGGAGMVGSAIVDRLIAAGAAEVAVLDDLSRGRRAHLAATLLRVMDAEHLGVESGPAGAMGGVPWRPAGVSAVRERLRWKPLIDLEDGLRRLVAWWRTERASAPAPVPAPGPAPSPHPAPDPDPADRS